MYYTRLTATCIPDYVEILLAEVSEAGFDTFMEIENGFEAYAEGESYNKQRLQEIADHYGEAAQITFKFEQVEKRNWNEEWEKSYEPVLVEETCLIRADFHTAEKQYPYEIIITPKMSFGTGHHQTTYLMIQSQLELNHQDKAVMDAGCGTAILSIMAAKLGARKVEAFDIDDWSVSNGLENIQINGCNNITIRKGTVRDMTFADVFDIVLANINKNILLDEIVVYNQYLSTGGHLLLSGFYEKDIVDIMAEARKYSLKQISYHSRQDWVALLLKKEE